MVLLEVCVDSLPTLRAAVSGGARRLEVCSRLDLGGLTPTDELMTASIATGLPSFAMIRPRGGDFVHDRAEIERMRVDLARMKAAGAHGFVLGVLDARGHVAVDVVRELVALAHPLPVTFHRAFDVVLASATTHEARAAAVQDLIACGVTRVLTSGGAADAFEGRAVLRELATIANGRLGILPGGGVRSHNAREILRATGVDELHSSTPFRLDEPAR